MANSRERILNSTIFYILFEVIVLSINYYLMLMGNDTLFALFVGTIIFLSSIGMCMSVYLSVIMLRKKIDSRLFFKCLIISLGGAFLPFIFLFFLMSQLH